MSDDLKFRITAVDTLTRAVKTINESIGKLGQPFRDLKTNIGNLGKELGFPKVADALKRVRSAASQVAANVRGILTPLLAVIGGGTIAGLVALTTEWAHLGFQVDQTAQSLGLSTQSLQAFQGAARIMGIEAGALDGGLKALGDTIEDALYGRNATALMMLNRLGVRIHKTKDGAIDSAAAFRDLAGAISKIKSPQVQGLVARQFGVEALLPLLRQGPAAIAEYERKARDLGAVMDGPAQAGAQRMGLALNYLGVAVQGLKNSIAAELAPVITPLIEQLTAWIGANRQLLAQRVAGWAKGFADWLKEINFNAILDGMTNFIAKIGSVVDALGGWKNVAKGFAALIAVEFIAPVFSLAAALATLTVAATPLLPLFAAIAALAGIGFAGYEFFKTPTPDFSHGTPKPAKPGMRSVSNVNALQAGLSMAAMSTTMPAVSLQPGTPVPGTAGAPGASGAAPAASGAPAAAAPRQRVDVHVTADSGLSASVKRVWDNGIPVGPAMVPGQ